MPSASKTLPECLPLPRAEQRQARREQLLDTAAALLVERGLTGLTMEAVAAGAGVSKALPYQHFDNSDAVVVELYHRELGRLTASIASAVSGIRGGDAIVAAALHAYFDEIETRGALLGILAGPGSQIPALVHGGQPAAAGGLADLLSDAYGLSTRVARVAAALVTGAAIAGSDAVARGDARRTEAERLTRQMITSGLRGIRRAGRPNA